MQGNTKDISFREFSARQHYPFTDSSNMRSTDGRRIPLSVVYDVILYPGEHSVKPLYVSRVYQDTDTFIEITDGTIVIRGTITADGRGCGLYEENGRRVGTMVFSDAGAIYLAGMAKTKALSFLPDGMVIRPDRVIPYPVAKTSVVVEGEPVTKTDTPLTAVIDSVRFSVIPEGEMAGTVSLDNQIGSDDMKRIITKINGVEVDNRPVYIRTDPSLNIQIVDVDGVITFHKRGDA